MTRTRMTVQARARARRLAALRRQLLIAARRIERERPAKTDLQAPPGIRRSSGGRGLAPTDR